MKFLYLYEERYLMTKSKNWKEDFGLLYRQRGQQRYGIRLLALDCIQSGKTLRETSSIVKRSERTLGDWIKFYETGGLDRLLSLGIGRGSKAKLQDKESFVKEVEQLQANREGGRINCNDIFEHIKITTGVEYSKSGMYKVLKKFGLVWITSRSIHPKSDPVQQEDFKKVF